MVLAVRVVMEAVQSLPISPTQEGTVLGLEQTLRELVHEERVAVATSCRHAARLADHPLAPAMARLAAHAARGVEGFERLAAEHGLRVHPGDLAVERWLEQTRDVILDRVTQVSSRTPAVLARCRRSVLTATKVLALTEHQGRAAMALFLEQWLAERLDLLAPLEAWHEAPAPSEQILRHRS
jgi:hypothetical protein